MIIIVFLYRRSDQSNDDKEFKLSAVRAQLKGQQKSSKSIKVDHSIIGRLPEQEYGLLLLYPDGLLFVVNDYSAALYIKYSNVGFIIPFFRISDSDDDGLSLREVKAPQPLRDVRVCWQETGLGSQFRCASLSLQALGNSHEV